MRRWVGRLHGGQIVMLLIPVLLVAAGLVWFGYEYFIVPASASFAAARVTPDTVLQNLSRQAGLSDSKLGFRFVGGGLLVAALSLPMLWWWFDARRLHRH